MTAHTYNPASDSLGDKIQAFKEASEAWHSIESSFKFYEDQGWSDRLGTKQELQEAKDIIRNSLSMASASVSEEDMNEALQQGLLSKQECEQLISEKQGAQNTDEKQKAVFDARKTEMKELREKRSNEKSMKDSSKRSR